MYGKKNYFDKYFFSISILWHIFSLNIVNDLCYLYFSLLQNEIMWDKKLVFCLVFLKHWKYKFTPDLTWFNFIRMIFDLFYVKF